MKTHSICLDARMLSSGGIGTYIRNLIPFIGEAFHLYLLISPKQEIPAEIKRYEQIPVNANIYSIQEQIVLPLAVPECDLFWSPHYNIPLLPLRARKRVVTIHDVYHLAFASSLNLLERTYAKIVMARAVAMANKVITVSQFSSNELCRYTGITREKIAVIYSGIDVDLFSSSPMPKKRVLPDRYFLFVGNFKSHKNIKGIIEAFRQFLEFEQADLVLVGKRKGLIHQEQVDELLEKNIAVRKRTHILEDIATEELPELYARAEALLFPSFYEGFGFPPLEALACGCPVIVSDIEIMRETCREASYFVNPQNPSEIKDKMLRVWEKKDPVQQQKGKSWATAFSWKNSAQQHIDLFDTVCKGKEIVCTSSY